MIVSNRIYKAKELFKGFESKKTESNRNIENIIEKLNFQPKNGNLNIINYIVEGLTNV